jgi:hypothetical protein
MPYILGLGLETSRAEPGSARLALARSSSEPSLARLGNFTSWWKRLGSARYRLASRLEPAREPQLLLHHRFTDQDIKCLTARKKMHKVFNNFYCITDWEMGREVRV